MFLSPTRLDLCWNVSSILHVSTWAEVIKPVVCLNIVKVSDYLSSQSSFPVETVSHEPVDQNRFSAGPGANRGLEC